ncbi:hypothetical protein [Gluconobacter thailandicus]|uniref:Uncharacterized protein n=1 Tax=Gluconobacter thailandicus TaxID=257438 RepID=A0AAP9ER59_GLUTH|nr:hypothetical protein [Gluconobacter thailandicus]KXV35404.1 hypothetical protein AD940_02750 [Gluconobacter thailandicus]QEH95714.1 hypothetical protein FXF46_05075 [Gluconobacter thailandicus]
MNKFRRPPISRTVWQRLGLTYVIALPMLLILFMHPPKTQNLLIQALILLLIVTAARIMARLIIRSDD